MQSLKFPLLCNNRGGVLKRFDDFTEYKALPPFLLFSIELKADGIAGWCSHTSVWWMTAAATDDKAAIHHVHIGCSSY